MELRDEAIQVLCEKAAALWGKDASEFDENTSFEDDLHARSANYVQLSAALEDEFEIEVPYMEFRKLKTFGEAGDWVAAQFGE